MDWKAALLKNLISVFKIAAWVIPGSTTHATFKESLTPFFKSMEKIKAVLTKVPEFTKVSFSFISPGEDLAGFKTYTGDATKLVIQRSQGPSPLQVIVLGTSAFGICCLFLISRLHQRLQGQAENSSCCEDFYGSKFMTYLWHPRRTKTKQPCPTGVPASLEMVRSVGNFQ